MAAPEQQINRLLATVALRIRQSLDLAEILNTTVQEVRQLLEVDRVLIYRFTPEWSGMVVVESVSNPDWSILGTTVSDNCFEQGWVDKYKTGSFSAREDIYSDDIEPCHVEFLQNFQVKANLVVPILVSPQSSAAISEQHQENDLWGLLIVHQCNAPRCWQPAEIDFLQQLADQVAIAIHQATLVEQLQTQLREREQAQEELRRQALIYNSLYDGVIVTNLAGEIIDWNLGSQRMFGYSKAEVLGKTPGILHKPEQASVLTQQIIESMKRDGWWSEEITFLRKDGSEGVCETVVVPMLDRQGNLIATVGVNHDITDRKQAQDALQQAKRELEQRVVERTTQLNQAVERLQQELAGHQRTIQALHESEARFRKTADSMPVLLWESGTDGLCTFFNQARLQFTGRTMTQELGTGWTQGVHPDDLDYCLRTYQDAFAARQNFQMEYRLQRADGEYRWVTDYGMPRFNPDGSFAGYLGSCIDISDRKQAEVALRQSEERFRLAVDNIPDIFVIYDAQRRIQFINSEGLRRLRLSLAEVIGKTDEEILPAYITQAYLPTLVAATSTGSIQSKECSITLPNQHQVTLIVTYVPLQDYQGNIGQILGIIQDISSRQQAEAEKAKLIDILEATPDIVATSGIDRQVHYLNRTARQLLGLAQNADLSGVTLSDVHPEWANAIINNAAIPTAIKEGSWLGESACLDREGKEIPVSQLIIAHKLADGSVQQLSTVARNLSKAKQIEATLIEAERRWRTFLENVRLVVVSVDHQGKVEYVNPFFLELTGYTPAEVIGQDWLATFVPTSQQQQVKQVLQAILNEQNHPHQQSSIVTKFGETRIIAWNHTLLRNLQGSAIGTMSIGEDITERYAVERMKEEFISVVSHELRTPLTSIHGALNLLSTNLVIANSQRGKRVIDIAAESAERLVRLVNDILELERLESGKLRLDKRQVDAAQLLLNAQEQMQVMANRWRISLVVRAAHINLVVDPDRIIQVLTNLLSNAIKFSPQGSTVLLAVEIEDMQHQQEDSTVFQGNNPINDDYVVFTVQDQGRGIPSDKLDSIFERFHQVDASDSRRKEGTGLGLAICRNIIEQHGGKIWADSMLGRGSTFYFTIPVQTLDNEENE